MKKTIEWEKTHLTNLLSVCDLKQGDIFTPDSGESWHIFERFGKSIIPGHVVIVTVEAATIPARLFDKVLIK